MSYVTKWITNNKASATALWDEFSATGTLSNSSSDERPSQANQPIGAAVAAKVSQHTSFYIYIDIKDTKNFFVYICIIFRSPWRQERRKKWCLHLHGTCLLFDSAPAQPTTADTPVSTAAKVIQPLVSLFYDSFYYL